MFPMRPMCIPQVLGVERGYEQARDSSTKQQVSECDLLSDCVCSTSQFDVASHKRSNMFDRQPTECQLLPDKDPALPVHSER